MEIQNLVTEIKNTLGGINSKLEETEEQMSNAEDRIMKSNQAEED